MSLKEEIRDVFEEVIGKNNFSDNDNIMDIGVTSLMVYKLSAVAGERYNINVSPMDIMMYPTVDKICGFLENKSSDSKEESTSDTSVRRRTIKRKAR